MDRCQGCMAAYSRTGKETGLGQIVRSVAIALGFLISATMTGSASASEAFIDRFGGDLGPSGWRTSEYAHPGQWIDTRWAKRQVNRSATGTLTIALEPDFRSEKSFASGEVRRRRTTHYGRYEAILQAAPGTGLNTAFFLYTGPHRGDPKDEIDIEILGKDTTRVFLNTFVGGAKQGGTSVPLGFDAAAGPNLYAIEWSADTLRWYANDRLLYELTTADGPLPITPAQVYLSLWAGGAKIKNWLGLAAPGTEAEAMFHCISFVPIGGTGPQCGDG